MVDTTLIGLFVAPARFVDNGDGTVTDAATGLMWEQKDDSGGLHDKDNVYTWPEAMSEFISSINGFDAAPMQLGFAGHTDWRVPTFAELKSILLQPSPCTVFPCISPTLGPVGDTWYWSSTTESATFPTAARAVKLFDGTIYTVTKADHVGNARAVRGP